jgi:pyridoxine/pyridoxamine 5'-phosphate oxidase
MMACRDKLMESYWIPVVEVLIRAVDMASFVFYSRTAGSQEISKVATDENADLVFHCH